MPGTHTTTVVKKDGVLHYTTPDDGFSMNKAAYFTTILLLLSGIGFGQNPTEREDALSYVSGHLATWNSIPKYDVRIRLTETESTFSGKNCLLATTNLRIQMDRDKERCLYAYHRVKVPFDLALANQTERKDLDVVVCEVNANGCRFKRIGDRSASFQATSFDQALTKSPIPNLALVGLEQFPTAFEGTERSVAELTTAIGSGSYLTIDESDEILTITAIYKIKSKGRRRLRFDKKLLVPVGFKSEVDHGYGDEGFVDHTDQDVIYSHVEGMPRPEMVTTNSARVRQIDGQLQATKGRIDAEFQWIAIDAANDAFPKTIQDLSKMTELEEFVGLSDSN
ncbi:hypothetical protein [Novipirellula sp.]|uniref:hypothetical protein n=1 Tax=Novipirellula sp. TaxID=2795430 RepID=UPI0035618FFD